MPSCGANLLLTLSAVLELCHALYHDVELQRDPYEDKQLLPTCIQACMVAKYRSLAVGSQEVCTEVPLAVRGRTHKHVLSWPHHDSYR